MCILNTLGFSDNALNTLKICETSLCWTFHNPEVERDLARTKACVQQLDKRADATRALTAASKPEELEAAVGLLSELAEALPDNAVPYANRAMAQLKREEVSRRMLVSYLLRSQKF